MFGGFSENADKKRAYVIYQNGLKKLNTLFYFLKIIQKFSLDPIIVPEKPEKNRTSVAEIVGYSTSLVSIIALIKSF